MKTERKISAIAALMLAGMVSSGVASASDEKYPAHQFQPTVVYSNPELIKTSVGPAVAAPVVQAAAPVVQDPKFPAAYFVPTRVFPTN
ncbi:MAG: hypothetical protein ACK443_05165 [Methylococcaceae bacterium]